MTKKTVRRRASPTERRAIKRSSDSDMATAALVGGLDAKVDNLIKNAENLNHAMFGTDGDKGMLPRMAVVEASTLKAEALLQQTAMTLDRLANLVEAHHNDKTKHTPWGLLTSSWKPMAAIAVGFIVLHTIATYVPNVMNVVLKLVGLPTIPLQ